MAQSVRISSHEMTEQLGTGARPARCTSTIDFDAIRRDTDSEDRCANLTHNQIQAFREAFELFDKNGGGTIDAMELQKTLTDVGININGNDLAEVMQVNIKTNCCYKKFLYNHYIIYFKENCLIMNKIKFRNVRIKYENIRQCLTT